MQTNPTSPALTPRKRRILSALKRFVYSQLYLRDVVLILFGRAKPLVRFTVEASPPSVYFNFEIREDQREALEKELALPLPLTTLRCLEGDKPFYCISLNIYRVSGLANGIRAEWSAYVRDPLGKPRYMVLEAASDSGAMDPINLITRGGEATYVETNEGLSMMVVAEGGGRFTSTCRNWTKGPVSKSAPEWIEANDYIYWRNGICDRTFYDSGMANPRARHIELDDVTIDDQTPWARYLEPTPRHVVVFEDAIEFAMSPWWNVDDLDP
jgi:hypothetical protein